MLELLRRRYRRWAPPLLSFSFPLPFLFSSSSFSSAQRPEFLNGYFQPVCGTSRWGIVLFPLDRLRPFGFPLGCCQPVERKRRTMSTYPPGMTGALHLLRENGFTDLMCSAPLADTLISRLQTGVMSYRGGQNGRSGLTFSAYTRSRGTNGFTDPTFPLCASHLWREELKSLLAFFRSLVSTEACGYC